MMSTDAGAPRKLNLGCGEDYKEGYVNVDFHGHVNIDVQHDLNSIPYPFADNSFDHVLAVLTDNRLLTLSDEARRVDLSHEALIDGWPRLHEWINERRAAELARRRLEDKAAERQRLRQSDAAGGLLDDVELKEAKGWIDGPDAVELGVSDELRTLVADSQRAIDAAALEKQRAAEGLRRRNQGLAVALAATVLLLALAVVLFFNARTAEATAQANADEAQQQPVQVRDAQPSPLGPGGDHRNTGGQLSDRLQAQEGEGDAPRRDDSGP